MPHVYGRISHRLQKPPAVHCPEVSEEKGVAVGFLELLEVYLPSPRLPRFVWLGALVLGS